MEKYKKKFFALSRDAVFKNVFYRDKKLLKTFLTDILSNFYDDIKIDNIEIKNAELTKDRLYIKNKVIDILVDIGSKIINVEVNVKDDNKRIYRNFFYLMSAIISSIKTSQNYYDVKEHIQINFNFMKDKMDGFNVSQYGNLETKEVTVPFIKTIDVNVDYFKDYWYNSGKTQEYYNKFKSIIMFGLDEEELRNLKDDDEYMKKIKNDIIELNSDDNFYQVMTDEEDIEMIKNSIASEYSKKGLEQGLKQGLEQGSKNREENIVRKMKEEKYPIEDIIKITGLSKEEIEKI